MSDLIRREDAIAKFKKSCTSESIDKNGIKRGEIHTAMTYEGIIKIIESLPSAEKWIPVTEALPKVRTDVLLAFEKNMTVGFYSHDCWNVNTGNGFYTGVFTDEDKPIAWMPLPEPWRGE